MAKVVASFSTHFSYLSSEFGLQLAIKKTGLTEAELEALVGRYKKGVRKGLLKGTIHWKKVTNGGWYKTGRYDFECTGASGFVVRYVGLCFAFGISVVPWKGETVCHWGTSESTDYTQDLQKACRDKQLSIEQYRESLKEQKEVC